VSALVSAVSLAVALGLMRWATETMRRMRVVARFSSMAEFGDPIGVSRLRMTSWPMVRSYRRRQLVKSLPDGLEAISRSVRSGASLPVAVREAASAVPAALGQDLQLIASQAELGRPMQDCLRAWALRNPLPDVRLTVAALTFAAQAGGAQSRSLEGLAQSIRDRQALRLEVSALSSQARMSGMVMAVLPVGFLAFSLTMDPEASEFLFATPIGLVCLCLGISLDVVGFVWMRSMTRAR